MSSAMESARNPSGIRRDASSAATPSPSRPDPTIRETERGGPSFSTLPSSVGLQGGRPAFPKDATPEQEIATWLYDLHLREEAGLT